MDEEAPTWESMLAINEALVLSALRQDALMEESARMNAQLAEMNQALLHGELRQQEFASALKAGSEHLRQTMAQREETAGQLAAAAQILAAGAKELEEKARLLDLSNDAIVVRDMEGRIRYWNRGAENLYGWTCEEALGKISHHLLATEFPTPIERMTEELHRTGHWMGELIHTTRDGQRLTVLARKTLDRDAEGHPAWVLENLTDITARKQAEQTLEASEARFRAAVSLVSSLLWTNNSEGRMEGPQPGWGNFTGQREEEYQGYGWARAVHPEDAQPTVAAWEQAVAGKRVFEFEHRIRRYDGQWRLCSIHAVPLFGDEGQVQEWVGVHTDITDRKHAEEALREAKDAAEAANASKDRFLAVLSHELRTPLTPVLMAASALEHDPDLSPEVREDMTMIKRNIELETKLIDDLLDLNRITSGKLELHIEAIDLNEAVRHVCDMLRSQINTQRVRLETELEETAAPIAADSARLQQVLWNVLRNAIKFTPEEGTIRVSTKLLPDGRREVRMQDTGMGISAEALPRIFHAFEQGGVGVTRQFGGLGLGLAICKGLVELHRGTIRAESEGPSHGSTFIIELPGEMLQAVAPSPDAIPAAKGRPQLRLLVVEDHADTARTLHRLLKAAGFAVIAAPDVATAIATAERETFDVLISDLGLPDGDGYEIMRRVREIRSVPGVAMSGYGMDEDLRRSREAGFAEHLVKPIDMGQLIAAIRRVADER